MAAGFDDAAFVDHAGRLTEATIWSLAFWDGTGVVWPEGRMLAGTTQQILQRQLALAGVTQTRLPVDRAALDRLTGAVVMNSWTPCLAVAAIGEHGFPDSPALSDLLGRAFQGEPPQRP